MYLDGTDAPCVTVCAALAGKGGKTETTKAGKPAELEIDENSIGQTWGANARGETARGLDKGRAGGESLVNPLPGPGT